jgi:hypothetical protein
VRWMGIGASGFHVWQRRYGEVCWPGPQVISGNGPQCIAKDFKEFVRLKGRHRVRSGAVLSSKQREAGALGSEPPA